MSTVFVNVGLSLDGYMAPEGMTMESWDRPEYEDWGVKWGAPWVRPGGTTFFFVNDGPEIALEQAMESAGSRDIRVAGGADVIQQYLNLGVIDELEIALAPVVFGGGRRLFENLREPVQRFRVDKVHESPAATHLRYVREYERPERSVTQ